MKFEFPLDKVLGHKRQLEDLARRDWLEAKAKVDASMKVLQGLYDQIDQARKRCGDLQITGGTQAGALVQIDEFLRGQKIRIERHREELRALMGEAERLQEILVEAAKEKKTLEKLRERRLEEFKLRRKKRELKATDELVTTRFKPEER